MGDAVRAVPVRADQPMVVERVQGCLRVARQAGGAQGVAGGEQVGAQRVGRRVRAVDLDEGDRFAAAAQHLHDAVSVAVAQRLGQGGDLGSVAVVGAQRAHG